MAGAILRILIIDDNESDIILLREMLTSMLEEQVALAWTPSFEIGQSMMIERSFDVVLVGAAWPSTVREWCAPVLLLTRPGNLEGTIAAMEAGAAAAIPFAELTPNLLVRSIRFVIEQKETKRALLGSQAHAQALTNRQASSKNSLKTAELAQINGKQTGEPCQHTLSKRGGLWDVPIVDERLLEIAQSEAIREKNRFNAVMEALPVGVAIIDMQGGIVETNREYNKIWGGSHPETSSVDDYEAYKAWWRDSGERVKPEEWASARAVQNGETVIGQMMQIQRFNGDRAFVINSAAPIFDTNGASMGSAVVIMDVTQQMLTEEALRESEYRLRIGLENSPVTVFSQNLDLQYTWVYNTAPPFSAEEMLGKRDSEIKFLDDAAELVAMKKSVIETGRGLRKEITLRVNGVDQFFHLTLEPLLDSRQQVTGLRGAAINITEQRLLMKQQLGYIEQMEVHHRLLEYREQERQVIARELHDGPIQDLAGLIFHAQAVKEEIKDDELLTEMDEIQSMLQQVMGNLRDVTNDLRPPALIRFGLQKAIQNHANEFIEKHPRILVDLNLQPADGDVRLSDQINLALFRIYQEAMNNIARHARAKKIWVQVEQRDGCIYLEVRDNGKGFRVHDEAITEHTHKERFGLAGMKERADAIGGDFGIQSAHGKGTRVLVKIPLNGNH